MQTKTQTPTITIPDRNETKYLFTVGFKGTPSPRDPNTLDFEFEATDALFEARRAYSLNHPCSVLSFIAASRYVDKAIYEHRQGKGARHE
jgi:hypothetical protein